MRVVGNYTLSSLFSSTDGPFFVTLNHIVATGNASIAVEVDGVIRTQNILMDINFGNLTMDFQNLGAKCKFDEGFEVFFKRMNVEISFWQVWWGSCSKGTLTIHRIPCSIQ